MAISYDVVHRNNFPIWLMHASGLGEYVQVGRLVNGPEWCQPLDVRERMRQRQTVVFRELKDDTDMCSLKTWIHMSVCQQETGQGLLTF